MNASSRSPMISLLKQAIVKDSRNIITSLLPAMPLEIERKYLVCHDRWRETVQQTYSFTQGYFSNAEDYCVRIRIVDDQRAFLTIKGNSQHLVARPEFEYSIPLEHAQDMLAHFCGNRTIRKLRHIVNFQGFRWEIDEFQGKHSPLMVAELELSSAEQTFPLPPWAGKDITGDVRFSNQFLAQHDLSDLPL